MTETEFEKVFIDGCSGTVPNHTLETVLYENMSSCKLPEYTNSEIEYARALKSTYNNTEPSGIGVSHDESIRSFVLEKSDKGEKPINNFLLPLYQGDHFDAGSTDVGDVSWQTPTAQIHVSCFASGAPGHSWQNVSIGKSSIGHKGLIYAGKVLACSAIDLYENPQIIENAKKELLSKTGGGFSSPIPDGETIKELSK